MVASTVQWGLLPPAGLVVLTKQWRCAGAHQVNFQSRGGEMPGTPAGNEGGNSERWKGTPGGTAC
jgi:hypothetical protein